MAENTEAVGISIDVTVKKDKFESSMSAIEASLGKVDDMMKKLEKMEISLKFDDSATKLLTNHLNGITNAVSAINNQQIKLNVDTGSLKSISYDFKAIGDASQAVGGVMTESINKAITQNVKDVKTGLNEIKKLEEQSAKEIAAVNKESKSSKGLDIAMAIADIKKYTAAAIVAKQKGFDEEFAAQKKNADDQLKVLEQTNAIKLLSHKQANAIELAEYKLGLIQRLVVSKDAAEKEIAQIKANVANNTAAKKSGYAEDVDLYKKAMRLENEALKLGLSAKVEMYEKQRLDIKDRLQKQSQDLLQELEKQKRMLATITSTTPNISAATRNSALSEVSKINNLIRDEQARASSQLKADKEKELRDELAALRQLGASKVDIVRETNRSMIQAMSESAKQNKVMSSTVGYQMTDRMSTSVQTSTKNPRADLEAVLASAKQIQYITASSLSEQLAEYNSYIRKRNAAMRKGNEELATYNQLEANRINGSLVSAIGNVTRQIDEEIKKLQQLQSVASNGVVLNSINKEIEALQRRKAVAETQRVTVSNAGLRADTDTQVQRLSGQTGNVNGLTDSINKLQMAMMALGVTLSVRSVMEYADHWLHFTNAVVIATEKTGGAVQMQERLFNLAQDSRAPLESITSIFMRMARAGEAMGVSQEKTVKAIEMVTKALAIMGTDPKMVRGGLLQLEQALGGVVVRGQEFKSILDSMPIITQSVAKNYMEADKAIRLKEAAMRGASKATLDAIKAEETHAWTISQLRNEMYAGNVMSKVWMEAMLLSANEINETFAKTHKTFAQAFQYMENSFTKWIGIMNQSSEGSDKFYQAMKLMGDNLNIVIGTVASLAAGLTAYGLIAGTVFLVSLNPIAAVIAAVAALATGFALLKDEIKVSDDGLATWGDVFREVVIDIESGINKLKLLFAALSENMGQNVKFIKDELNKVADNPVIKLILKVKEGTDIVAATAEKYSPLTLASNYIDSKKETAQAKATDRYFQANPNLIKQVNPLGANVPQFGSDSLLNPLGVKQFDTSVNFSGAMQAQSPAYAASVATDADSAARLKGEAKESLARLTKEMELNKSINDEKLRRLNLEEKERFVLDEIDKMLTKDLSSMKEGQRAVYKNLDEYKKGLKDSGVDIIAQYKSQFEQMFDSEEAVKKVKSVKTEIENYQKGWNAKDLSMGDTSERMQQEIEQITKTIDIKQPKVKLSVDQEHFVAKFGAAAELAAKQLGTSVSTVLAHAANESGWGSSALAKDGFNFFGMKPGKGWRGETMVNPLDKQLYRKYATPEEGLAGYANMISKQSNFNSAVGKSGESYFSELKKGGYATDPNFIAANSRIAAQLEGTNTLQIAQKELLVEKQKVLIQYEANHAELKKAVASATTVADIEHIKSLEAQNESLTRQGRMIEKQIANEQSLHEARVKANKEWLKTFDLENANKVDVDKMMADALDLVDVTANIKSIAKEMEGYGITPITNILKSTVGEFADNKLVLNALTAYKEQLVTQIEQSATEESRLALGNEKLVVEQQIDEILKEQTNNTKVETDARRTLVELTRQQKDVLKDLTVENERIEKSLFTSPVELRKQDLVKKAGGKDEQAIRDAVDVQENLKAIVSVKDMVVGSVTSGFATMFDDVLNKGKSFSDAFRDMFKNMISSISTGLMNLATQALMSGNFIIAGLAAVGSIAVSLLGSLFKDKTIDNTIAATSEKGTVLGSSDSVSSSIDNVVKALNDIHAQEYPELKALNQSFKGLQNASYKFVTDVTKGLQMKSATLPYQSNLTLNSSQIPVSKSPLYSNPASGIGLSIGQSAITGAIGAATGITAGTSLGVAGSFVGGAVTGATSVGGGAAAGAVGTGMAGIIGGAIVGAGIGLLVGGLIWGLGKLLGIGKIKVTQIGEGILLNNINLMSKDFAEQFDPQAFAKYSIKQKGWFSSKTTIKEVFAPLNDEFSASLLGVITALRDSAIVGIQALGIGDLLAGKLDVFQTPTLKLDWYMDKAKNPNMDVGKYITDQINAYSDRIAEGIFKNLLGQFQQMGEGMLETVGRLAIQVATVTAMFRKNGIELQTTGMGLIELSDSFAQMFQSSVDAKDGLKNFITVMNDFYDATTTQVEKSQNAIRSFRQLAEKYPQIGGSKDIMQINAEGLKSVMKEQTTKADTGATASGAALDVSEYAKMFFGIKGRFTDDTSVTSQLGKLYSGAKYWGDANKLSASSLTTSAFDEASPNNKLSLLNKIGGEWASIGKTASVNDEIQSKILADAGLTSAWNSLPAEAKTSYDNYLAYTNSLSTATKTLAQNVSEIATSSEDFKFIMEFQKTVNDLNENMMELVTTTDDTMQRKIETFVGKGGKGGIYDASEENRFAIDPAVFNKILAINEMAKEVGDNRLSLTLRSGESNQQKLIENSGAVFTSLTSKFEKEPDLLKLFKEKSDAKTLADLAISSYDPVKDEKVKLSDLEAASTLITSDLNKIVEQIGVSEKMINAYLSTNGVKLLPEMVKSLTDTQTKAFAELMNVDPNSSEWKAIIEGGSAVMNSFSQAQLATVNEYVTDFIKKTTDAAKQKLSVESLITDGRLTTDAERRMMKQAAEIDNTFDTQTEAEIARKKELFAANEEGLFLQDKEAAILKRNLALANDSQKAAIQYQQEVKAINDKWKAADPAKAKELIDLIVSGLNAAKLQEASNYLKTFGQTIKDWVNNLRATQLGSTKSQLDVSANLFNKKLSAAENPFLTVDEKRKELANITGAADTYINAIKNYYGASKEGIDLIESVVQSVADMPEQLDVQEMMLDRLTSLLDVNKETNDILASVGVASGNSLYLPMKDVIDQLKLSYSDKTEGLTNEQFLLRQVKDEQLMTVLTGLTNVIKADSTVREATLRIAQQSLNTGTSIIGSTATDIEKYAQLGSLTTATKAMGNLVAMFEGLPTLDNQAALSAGVTSFVSLLTTMTSQINDKNFSALFPSAMTTLSKVLNNVSLTLPEAQRVIQGFEAVAKSWSEISFATAWKNRGTAYALGYFESILKIVNDWSLPSADISLKMEEISNTAIDTYGKISQVIKDSTFDESGLREAIYNSESGGILGVAMGRYFQIAMQVAGYEVDTASTKEMAIDNLTKVGAIGFISTAALALSNEEMTSAEKVKIVGYLYDGSYDYVAGISDTIAEASKNADITDVTKYLKNKFDAYFKGVSDLVTLPEVTDFKVGLNLLNTAINAVLSEAANQVTAANAQAAATLAAAQAESDKLAKVVTPPSVDYTYGNSYLEAEATNVGGYSGDLTDTAAMQAAVDAASAKQIRDDYYAKYKQLVDFKNSFTDIDALNAYYDMRPDMLPENLPRPFANGGAFTNGIVDKPTFFNMGLMGEAGSEAIMPLTNVNGKLGVYAANDSNANSEEELAELKAQNANLTKIVNLLVAQNQVHQAGYSAIIEENQQQTDSLRSIKQTNKEVAYG